MRVPSVASPVPQQGYTTQSYPVQGYSIQSYDAIRPLDQHGISYYDDGQRNPAVEIVRAATLSSSKYKNERRAR